MDIKKRQPLGVELVKREVVTEGDMHRAFE